MRDALELLCEGIDGNAVSAQPFDQTAKEKLQLVLDGNKSLFESRYSSLLSFTLSINTSHFNFHLPILDRDNLQGCVSDDLAGYKRFIDGVGLHAAQLDIVTISTSRKSQSSVRLSVLAMDRLQS